MLICSASTVELTRGHSGGNATFFSLREREVCCPHCNEVARRHLRVSPSCAALLRQHGPARGKGRGCRVDQGALRSDGAGCGMCARCCYDLVILDTCSAPWCRRQRICLPTFACVQRSLRRLRDINAPRQTCCRWHTHKRTRRPAGGTPSRVHTDAIERMLAALKRSSACSGRRPGLPEAATVTASCQPDVPSEHHPRREVRCGQHESGQHESTTSKKDTSTLLSVSAGLSSVTSGLPSLRTPPECAAGPLCVKPFFAPAAGPQRCGACCAENRCVAAREDGERAHLRRERVGAERARAADTEPVLRHRYGDDCAQWRHAGAERSGQHYRATSSSPERGAGHDLRRRRSTSTSKSGSPRKRRPQQRTKRAANDCHSGSDDASPQRRSSCAKRRRRGTTSSSSPASPSRTDSEGKREPRHAQARSAVQADRAGVSSARHAEAALGCAERTGGEEWAFDEQLHAQLSQGRRRGRGGVGSRVFEQGECIALLSTYVAFGASRRAHRGARSGTRKGGNRACRTSSRRRAASCCHRCQQQYASAGCCPKRRSRAAEPSSIERAHGRTTPRWIRQAAEGRRCARGAGRAEGAGSGKGRTRSVEQVIQAQAQQKEEQASR